MLVDPELAERARELLREPRETNGKVWHMSALGTHEITAGIGLGLEPPLSPPVVRGPSASVPMPSQPANDNISDLPSPPPAIRPPETAPAAPEPTVAPVPQAEIPQQPEQAPVPAQPEPVQPAALPEPVQLQPETPAAEPEPELPVMAPAEEPVVDYFAQQEPADEALPEIAPVEATPVEPAALPEIAPIPLVAPAAPVEEPAAELPTMAPPEPEVEIAPVAFFAPQPASTAAWSRSARSFPVGDLLGAHPAVLDLEHLDLVVLVDLVLVDADHRLLTRVDRAWVRAAASSMRSFGMPSSMACAMPPCSFTSPMWARTRSAS